MVQLECRIWHPRLGSHPGSSQACAIINLCCPLGHYRSREHQTTAMKAALYKCQSPTQTLEFHIHAQVPLLTPGSPQEAPAGESAPRNSWH